MIEIFALDDKGETRHTHTFRDDEALVDFYNALRTIVSGFKVLPEVDNLTLQEIADIIVKQPNKVIYSHNSKDMNILIANTRFNHKHYQQVLKARGEKPNDEWLLKNIINVGELCMLSGIATKALEDGKASEFIDELRKQKHLAPETVQEICGVYYQYL